MLYYSSAIWYAIFTPVIVEMTVYLGLMNTKARNWQLPSPVGSMSSLSLFINICIYIYIYWEREREREGERERDT